MSGLITRITNAQQLEVKGYLRLVYGNAYKKYPEEWSQIFNVLKSDKAEERGVQNVGMGLARITAEGAETPLDSGGEGYKHSVRNFTVRLGFAITQEAEEDGQMGSTAAQNVKDMAEAFRTTKETLHANKFNYGTDTGAANLYSDGKPLFATDHPLANGGTLSNKLATNAQISVTALENLLTQMNQVTDDRGRPKMILPKLLVHGTGTQFTVERLLKSDGQSDTANRAINAIKSTGSIPKTLMSHYLSNANTWLIVSDVDSGLTSFDRVAYSDDMYRDPKTTNLMYWGRERYSMTAFDSPRAAFAGYI